MELNYKPKNFLFAGSFALVPKHNLLIDDDLEFDPKFKSLH